MQNSILARPRQLCVMISPRSLLRAYLQTAAGQPSCRPAGAPCDFGCLQQGKREEFLLLLLVFVLTKGSLTSARLFYKQALAVIKTCSKHSTMSSVFLHLSKSSQRWPGMIFFFKCHCVKCMHISSSNCRAFGLHVCVCHHGIKEASWLRGCPFMIFLFNPESNIETTRPPLV